MADVIFIGGRIVVRVDSDDRRSREAYEEVELRMRLLADEMERDYPDYVTAI